MNRAPTRVSDEALSGSKYLSGVGAYLHLAWQFGGRPASCRGPHESSRCETMFIASKSFGSTGPRSADGTEQGTWVQASIPSSLMFKFGAHEELSVAVSRRGFHTRLPHNLFRFWRHVQGRVHLSLIQKSSPRKKQKTL